MKNIILIVAILIIIVLAFIIWGDNPAYAPENTNTDNQEVNFTSDGGEEKVDMQISYSPESASEMIVVEYPNVGQEVSSPLNITGEAKGTWFFEATAPVVLTNWDGLIIAEGYIEAEGDWMTEDFVSYTGTLNFEEPDYKDNGFLILQRANPSGLPENDAAVEIPIYFK